MSRTVIRVQGIGKEYVIGARQKRAASLQEAVRAIVSAPLRRLRALRGEVSDEERFWALRDVSFDVGEGEVVGIIGRNGAGKSTLLKILSRITEPTEGRIEIRGRVSSLLEVGTGFHPMLTGRENVFLNGAVLGMSRAEIRRKFDEIVDFSGVEKFIDTPVRRYSSGMKVRLAFAVAAHLEPEVLIIDEVLAVGDAEFQKKCLGKMQDVASIGRTVLFVSHNMIAVQSLCSRAIVMADGRVAADEACEEAVGIYLAAERTAGRETVWPDVDTAPGNEVVRIARFAVLAGGSPEATIAMETDIDVEIDYEVTGDPMTVHAMFHLLNEKGIVVLTSAPPPRLQGPGRYRGTCRIPGGLLNSGQYALRLQVVRNGSEIIYRHDDIASFDVVDTARRDGGWMGREPGVVQPRLPWKVQAADEPVQRQGAA